MSLKSKRGLYMERKGSKAIRQLRKRPPKDGLRGNKPKGIILDELGS